jgi:hypothetical protein
MENLGPALCRTRVLRSVAILIALAVAALSSVPESARAAPNSLYAGAVMAANTNSNFITPSLISSSQGANLVFIMQPDCNLVLYFGGGAIWNSGTEGRGQNCQARMQTDGNFVIYDDQNRPVWATNTQGYPGAFLIVQNDGNVVIYKNNSPLWNSGTDLSYAQNCNNVALSGGNPTILRASCKDYFGNWQQSSVTLDGCTGIVQDINGILRCTISETMGGFDIVSIPSDIVAPNKAETKIWRIDQPNVQLADDPMPAIQFAPGETFSVNADGCVQTGGMGQTWKSYVNPSGDKADHLYSGTIQIAGVIPSAERIAAAIQQSPQLVGSGDIPQNQSYMFLHLGYQDDNYGDNGYSSHDNGNNNQCQGIGPAWVEITIDIPPPSQLVSTAPMFSPGSKPFDLVWDINSAIDANGLPLNPMWFPQIMSQDLENGFQSTCGGAFKQDFNIDQTVLADTCTTDAPTADIDTGLAHLSLGAICPANPIHGHLNWGVATYTGNLTWASWAGDSSFGQDGDYTINLATPNNNGLTAAPPDGGPGLHLEFNESEVQLVGPFWQSLFNAVQGGDSTDPGSILNGKFAVVTGLFGIDGVHGGG